MPATVIEQTKKQKYLIIVLVVLVLVIFIVIYRGYFAKEILPIEPTGFMPGRKLEINFETLKNPVLNQLQPFEKIEPLGPEVSVGRENPFIPYQSTTTSK